MYSFGHAFPFGYGNDGLLDVRFAASRDGRTIRYVKLWQGFLYFGHAELDGRGHT